MVANKVRNLSYQMVCDPRKKECSTVDRNYAPIPKGNSRQCVSASKLFFAQSILLMLRLSVVEYIENHCRMSTQDSLRWNARYKAGAYSTRQHPSDLLVRWLDTMTEDVDSAVAKPAAWDIACGAGRNSVYLARRGYSVVGVDIAAAGLQQAQAQLQDAQALEPTLELQGRFLEHDLESGQLPPLSTAPSIIVVIRYLNLPLMPVLLQRLAPKGHLLVEVHLHADAVYEPVGGPGSNRFRAPPGALAGALAAAQAEVPYRVIYSNEGLVRDPDGSAMALAQLVVQRL